MELSGIVSKALHLPSYWKSRQPVYRMGDAVSRDQYSSASMMVMIRSVTVGSAGSGEPNSRLLS
jgi:hypothetical protein